MFFTLFSRIFIIYKVKLLHIKKLFQNIGLLVILNILVKPVWLLTDLVVQDRISHEKYGIYAAVYSLSFLFINLSDLGVNSYVTRELSMDKENLKHIFSNTFTFKIVTCIAYPFFILFVGYIIGYDKESLYYLFILGLVQTLMQTVAFFRANFQARQLFQIDGLAGVADKVILFLIVVILLQFGITLSLFIYSIFISSFITCLVFFIVTIKIQGWIRPSFSFESIQKILTQSLPFALMAILYAINERVDMVMIERLGGVLGKENAGLYAAPYRWLDAFMMYLWTLLPVFFAKFAAHHKEPKEQQDLFNFGQLIAYIPMLFVGVFVMIYGDKLFWMFKHSSAKELEVMTQIIKVLFIGAIVQGAFAIYSTYLTSTGYEKVVSKMIVLSLTVNITLNWIFIPSYGPVAAAYTTLISNSLICILYLIYVAKYTPLKIPVFLLLRLSLVSILFTLIFYLLTYTSFNWLWNTFIAGAFLLLITYIFNRSEIRSLLKGKSI